MNRARGKLRGTKTWKGIIYENKLEHTKPTRPDLFVPFALEFRLSTPAAPHEQVCAGTPGFLCGRTCLRCRYAAPGSQHLPTHPCTGGDPASHPRRGQDASDGAAA